MSLPRPLSRLGDALRSGWAEHRARSTEAGATLVEYALVAALVVVVAAGSITFLQSSAEDDLQERADNAGAPDLGTGSSLPPTTGATTTTAPPPPPSTTASTRIVSDTLTGTGTKVGSDWTATVLVRLTDQDDDPAIGLTVTASWAAPVTGETSCISGTDGSCTMSSNEIDRKGQGSIASATLTLSNVTGSNASWSPGDTSIAVANPG